MLPAIKPFVDNNISNGIVIPPYHIFLNFTAKFYLQNTFLNFDVLKIIYKYIPCIIHDDIHTNCHVCELNLYKQIYNLYDIKITFQKWILIPLK